MNFEADPENSFPAPEAIPAEIDPNKELEPGFAFDFYVTDHSADREDTGNPETLRELYGDIKKDGVDSVRYDWHWRNVEPEQGSYSEEHVARYAQAKEIMQETGLKAPTVILSNPPKWAVELYKQDKEKFFEAYAQYAAEVKRGLETAGGEKVGTLQVLNELNNTVYTPVKLEDIPRLCEITREAFRDYNPDVKLSVTLLAGNLARFTGEPIDKFLPKLKEVKDSFDTVVVDNYPGLWHLDPKGAKSLAPSELYKAMVKNTDLLKSTFEELATWDKDYELGETGMRTNAPLGGGEKAQRYFYDAFFRSFKHMMTDFRRRGLRLPSRIGLYEAIDEPPRTKMGKFLRKYTPFPEHDLGMRTGDGQRKMILQGSPHLPEERRTEGPSQLKKIMSYLRAPMSKRDEE